MAPQKTERELIEQLANKVRERVEKQDKRIEALKQENTDLRISLELIEEAVLEIEYDELGDVEQSKIGEHEDRIAILEEDLARRKKTGRKLSQARADKRARQEAESTKISDNHIP